MAISFNKLKNPKLGLTDVIGFGKLKGCRVCDVAQDHYEYLIWAEKNGFVKFQQESVDLILEQASFARWEIHQAEEVDPWKDNFSLPPDVFFPDEDIPF
jgi:uncharacterized protein (DUF3820 family)